MKHPLQAEAVAVTAKAFKEILLKIVGEKIMVKEEMKKLVEEFNEIAPQPFSKEGNEKCEELAKKIVELTCEDYPTMKPDQKSLHVLYTAFVYVDEKKAHEAAEKLMPILNPDAKTDDTLSAGMGVASCNAASVIADLHTVGYERVMIRIFEEKIRQKEEVPDVVRMLLQAMKSKTACEE